MVILEDIIWGSSLDATHELMSGIFIFTISKICV